MLNAKEWSEKAEKHIEESNRMLESVEIMNRKGIMNHQQSAATKSGIYRNFYNSMLSLGDVCQSK